MYDLLFVKRRRRRKIAALVALFSSFGVSSLVIISFLGRSVGTFTVALNNSEVKLALLEKEHSTNYSTYLRVTSNSNYVESTFEDLRYKLNKLDDETTPSDDGEKDQTYVDTNGKTVKGKCLEYFKYTFYVKNIGSKTAAYSLKINIDDRTRADDNTGRSLDDTLRVMVFENKPDSDKHDYRVFAKKAAANNIDINGVATERELISRRDLTSNQETEECRLAEMFADGGTIAEYTTYGFIKNDMTRYTIVVWLEGTDPQSDYDKKLPKGATLKLGVDITAHENE